MRLLPVRGRVPLAVFLASIFLLQLAGFRGAIAIAQEDKEGKGTGKGFKKEVVAVMDLKATGARELLALAASIRLREELLRSGYFILVDRQRLKQVLDEQALGQISCVETNCNIAAGKITGARIIMTGDLIQLSENTWQVSAIMTDVETGEALRAESIFFEGSSPDLITEGMSQLADRLIPDGNPEKYGGVINFLLQKSVDLVKEGASVALGVEQDEETGKLKIQEDTRLRFWGSPLSVLIYTIYDSNIDELEDLSGSGISIGLEREIEKSWGFGGSFHYGTMDIREDHTDPSTDEIEISGSYYAWSLSIFDAVPNGHPWFFYGTGLMGISMEYTDAGGAKEADLIGVLLMFRLMYTFEGGVVLGYAQEFGLITLSSSGTRIDELKAGGYDVNTNASGGLGYIMIGYNF